MNYGAAAGIGDTLKSVIDKLRRHGLDCEVSLGELLRYLAAPSYEDDRIAVEEVAGNELLLMHEVAEICMLKRLGYRVTENILLEAYPDTYWAHLEAITIELREARRQGRIGWIKRRCRDLTSYLDDPYLPKWLEKRVHSLLDEFCRQTMNGY